jgi:DNA-binding transcriptional ArsR family regulator
MERFHQGLLMVTEDLVFKAIAHPARRAMLSLLAISERTVKELTHEFSMSQPAVSQHLKELREAELVSADRVGTERRYRLTAQPLRYVLDWSAQYRDLIDPAGQAWSLVQTPSSKPAGTHMRQSHGS